MIEIRFHGRGGAGTVIASQAFAKAAFYSGKNALTFPSFGAERRGAPVMAFARIDDKKIYKRTQIYNPDIMVCLDDALMQLVDVAQGLKENGLGVLNSPEKPEDIRLSSSIKVAVVDANKISMEELGRPITNSAMLGALVKSTNIVTLEKLEKAIMSSFGSKLGEKLAKQNINAARRAYEETIFGETKGGRNYEQFKPWLPNYEDFPIGTIIPQMIVSTGQRLGPGSAVIRKTGTWSHYKAVIDNSKCIKCRRCIFHCPEATIHEKEDGTLEVDISYCKACGVCIKECPKEAISMTKIEKFTEIL